MTLDSVHIAVAVLPAIILMVFIYRADRLEKESPRLLLGLMLSGIFAIPLAIALETVGEDFILPALFTENTWTWVLVDNFVVIALVEEFSKYLFMKRQTWNHPEFNCHFDGVVYCVFASLVFALLENIGYVGLMGLEVGLLRAVTAVPGHACFGAIMGIYYGRAKRFETEGSRGKAAALRRAAVIIPALWHGAYDTLATVGLDSMFFGLIIIMYIYAIGLVRRAARSDSYFVTYSAGAGDISYYLFNDRR
jgi:RsiW-degrading membrane proteinase PrsW (M82 family)